MQTGNLHDSTVMRYENRPSPRLEVAKITSLHVVPTVVRNDPGFPDLTDADDDEVPRG